MNYDEVRKLIDDMGKVDFEELNLEFPDGIKIGMKKSTKGAVNTAITTTSNVATSAVALAEKEDSEEVNEVLSPMVGTFYSSPSPDAKPFVQVGDKVKKGQVLCIIEAMKLMNEIESEYDGEVVEICVKNEGIVEYGMPLFKIK